MPSQNQGTIKSKMFSGLFWKFLESGGVQGIQFIIQIILARLLSPDDYGLLAIITVFIAIANIFVSSGFGHALIQKKEINEIDLSSVFYLSLIISVILYLFLFLVSPYIALFYANPLLIPIIKVQGLTVVFGAVRTIQNSIISREMDFKKSFKVRVYGTIVSGVIGILMAFGGYGVWALVASNVLGTFIETLILWYSVSWRPKIIFSINTIRSLFRFSSNLLITSIIEVISNNIYSLVIGKIYSNQMLGYYNRGQNIPNLLMSNINGPITGVMFPALSQYQNDQVQVKKIVKRSILTSSFIVFPLMVGLAVVAEPLTLLLLTEKWLPSVPFMQLSCITFAFWPIHSANVEAICAVGRSDISLKLQVIKKTLLVLVLIITMNFGIYSIMIGSAIISFLSTFINAWPNKKLFSYSTKEQFVDLAPAAILSLVMGGIVYSIIFLRLDPLVTILLQIIIGIVIYISGAHVFKMESYTYLLGNIKLYHRKGDIK